MRLNLSNTAGAVLACNKLQNYCIYSIIVHLLFAKTWFYLVERSDICRQLLELHFTFDHESLFYNFELRYCKLYEHKLIFLWWLLFQFAIHIPRQWMEMKFFPIESIKVSTPKILNSMIKLHILYVKSFLMRSKISNFSSFLKSFMLEKSNP